MDDMKAAFEKWAEEVGALPWGYLKKQRTASGGYSVQIYTYMWSAWQASRSAIEIELSEPFDFDHSKALVYDMDEVVEAITSHGIRIKGKTE